MSASESQEPERHTKATLMELDNSEPVVKLGEHGDQFRLADGDLEPIDAVEVVELDESWTDGEISSVDDPEELPESIFNHLKSQYDDE